MSGRPSRRAFLIGTGGVASGAISGTGGAAPMPVIAALFPGKIDDGGFMEAGYRGLVAARDKLGVEIAWKDQVKPERDLLAGALRGPRKRGSSHGDCSWRTKQRRGKAGRGGVSRHQVCRDAGQRPPDPIWPAMKCCKSNRLFSPARWPAGPLAPARSLTCRAFGSAPASKAAPPSPMASLMPTRRSGC